MPTSVENYIFGELPRRLVVDPTANTGTSLTAGWVIVATGNGFQAVPVDPSMLGFEHTLAPATGDPTTQYYRGDKTWQTLDASAVGAIASSEKGTALGVATLDADGYVLLSQMNPSVVERVVIVADEAARYALTTLDVQNGDVVNQQSPLPATMWFVVDQNNLDSSAGYLPFSAGVAASVAWSGITGKPAILGDLEDISLAAEGDLIQFVAGNWVNVEVASLKDDLALGISDIGLLQNSLDAKQDQSTILDNLSAISTKGVVVRTSDGAFIGREVVGVNGIAVTEGKGDADNISLSLTEVGVAGTYGDDDNYPTYEVDAYGRVTSTTIKSLVKDTLTLLDQVADQTLVSNTTYQIGAYVETLNLLVPDPVVGGTKITLEVPPILGTPVGDINVSFPSGKELFGFVPSISLKSMMNPLPGDRITFTYIDNLSQWVVYKAPGLYLRELYLVGDSTANPTLEPSFFHSVASKATDSRVLSIPDRDVDLSSVGQTEFTSSEFSVIDPSDPSKKVAFSVGAITAGQTRVVTVPDHNVDLGLVGKTDFADNVFRVSDNTDATKKIAFQASGIATGQERTITMPNADVYLGKVPTGVTPTYATGRLMVPLADGTSIPLSAFGGTRLPNLNSPATVLAANGHYLFYSNTGSYYTVICALVLPTAPDDATYVRISNISSLDSFATDAGATVAPGGSDKINGVAATFSITDYLVNYRNAVITLTYSAFSENWTVSVLGDLINPSTIAIYDADKTNSTTLTPVADLTADRVITLPDADVNLGKVAQAASTSTDGYLTATDWNTFSSSKYFYKLLNTAGSTRATPLEVGKSYRLSGSATAVAESTPIFLPSATQDAFGNANSAPISFVVGDNSVSGRGFLLSAQPGQGIFYTGSIGIVTGPILGAADPTAPTESTAVWVPNFSSVTCYMIANGYWFVSILHGSNRMPSDKLFLVDPLDATKRAKFITSGIGTSQTRSITIPDANVDLGKVAQAASTSVDGYLTATDWNTFDRKLKTINHTSAGTITLVPGYKVTQIISTAATMTLTGGVATDQSEIVRIIARADTVISLSGAIIGFGDGHTLNNIGTTYTVYKGETIDLFMPAATALYVHGQHIQDSGSLAIYKPTTNNKISFNLSALTASKTITFPDANVDLGTIVTAAQINWGFVGFGTTPAGLTITTASGATSQVDMSSVIVSSENLVNGLVHGARKSARYIVVSASTFNVDLNTLAYPYYVQFEANHGGGTATLVITLAGITTFLDAKSCTSLGGSPLTIKITPGEVITIRKTNDSTYAIVDRSLDVGIASDNRVSSGYRAVFRAPDDFTANRTITVPDANVNFGDLPRVATTNNNVLTGTRTQILGGQNNNVSGTDNVAIASHRSILSGTGNTVINCGVSGGAVGSGVTCAGSRNTFTNCQQTTVAAGATDNVLTSCTLVDIQAGATGNSFDNSGGLTITPLIKECSFKDVSYYSHPNLPFRSSITGNRALNSVVVSTVLAATILSNSVAVIPKVSGAAATNDRVLAALTFAELNDTIYSVHYLKIMGHGDSSASGGRRALLARRVVRVDNRFIGYSPAQPDIISITTDGTDIVQGNGVASSYPTEVPITVTAALNGVYLEFSVAFQDTGNNSAQLKFTVEVESHYFLA